MRNGALRCLVVDGVTVAYRHADGGNTPPSEVIAQEIVDDLEAALEQFRLIAGDLAEKPA